MIIYENKRDTFLAEYRPGFAVEPHLHHHIELVHLLQGEMDVAINGVSYRAVAGDTVIIFPNQIHSFDDLPPLCGYIIITSPDEYPEFGSLFKNNLPASPIVHSDNAEVEHLFSAIQQYAIDKPTYYRELVRGNTLSLLCLLLPLMELHPQNTVQLSITQQILLYCDEHYTEPLTLENLSRKFGVSRFYISHLFGDKINITFNTYLHMLRTQAAKALLQRPDRSITDVAYTVGYNNVRSFNRHFIAATGYTPSEYRRKCGDK